MADDLTKITEDSARGGFYLFSGATVATVILAISAILIGRLLGPEMYGQYNLVLVIPSLLLLITDLGVNTGIVKFTASLRKDGKEGRVTHIIRHGTFFRLIVGAVVFALSLIFAGYFAMLINHPDFTFYIQIASVSLIFQVVYTTSTSAFVGLDRSEYNALATNIQAIAKTAIQIAFVLLGYSIAGALIGYVGGYIIASVIAGAILFFKLLRKPKKEENEHFRRNLSLLTHYGMPLYVSVMLIGILPQYQRVILSFFTSDVAIGNYQAASNFLQLLAVIPSSITTALLPAFSKLDSSTLEKVNIFFKRANKYTCLLIVPTTALILLFSTQIVRIVYGSVYSSAPFYLSISCLAYFFVIIGSLSLTSLFNGVGETGLTFRVTVINFVMLFGLSPIFAYVYGVPGALVASLISSGTAACYGAYIGIRKLKITFDLKPTTRIYLAAFSSSIPSLLLLYFTHLNDELTFIIGAVSYLAIFITLMPLLGIVNHGEISALSNVTMKIPLLNRIAPPLLKYQRRILGKTAATSHEPTL